MRFRLRTAALPVLAIFLTALLWQCRITPRDVPGVRTIEIPGYYRVQFNLQNHGQTQRGKMILKLSPRNDGALVFLSPINQILFRLYVRGRRVLLVSHRRKQFWRGSFAELIRRLWGLDLSFGDLVRLITDNRRPPAGSGEPEIFVKIKEARFPKSIEIRYQGIRLRLRIHHSGGPALMTLSPDTGGYAFTPLEEILTD